MINGNSGYSINGSSNYGTSSERQGMPWIFWVTTPVGNLR
jgi:hypothetical protein